VNSKCGARRHWLPALVAMGALCAVGSAQAAVSAWMPDVYYTAGTVVSYNGQNYSALVNQTDYSGTGWNPTTASLWTPVGAASGGGSSGGGGSTGGGSSGGGSSGGGSTGGGTSGGSCAATWSPTQVYTGGNTASENGINYTANWWTQGNDPATNSGPSGSGQPWTSTGSCTGGTAGGGGTGGGSGGGTGGGATPPPGPFAFGPYKDVTVSMNWNTNVISSAATGTLQPVLTVMPTNLKTMTWSFATGECGSENWAGIQPNALVSANVQNWVSMGKFYIIATGGAAGTFTCGSDAGFTSFINRYNSSSLLGIDFDIEGGQNQDVINNLVQRVVAAERTFPNLRFSFTVATLGGNSPNSLNQLGAWVMSAIKTFGLTKYTINLMVMDYGSTSPGNCTIVGSSCEMAQSAIAAAENLHSFYGTPYANIELTPMIGGNDTQSEVFTIPDVATISAYAAQKGLAGIHFWSFDRDNDCPAGSASATCNSYGQAGRLGFTTQFLSSLGQ
jgi:chitinase